MRRALSALLVIFCMALVWSRDASAQFRDEAFSQSYNSDKFSKDSVDVLFSFKEYFDGLGHKCELKPGNMCAGSAVFLGGCQIYNGQYWKLPIVYTTVLGSLGAGIVLNTKGNHEAAKYCFIGTGVAYWATMMDGIASYKADWPRPGKATIYSILCPGLGQIYNHELWKIPIYVGGLAASYYFLNTNTIQYERYRRIYKEATNPDEPYTGPISAETALYYRDSYRRLRDYSILALAAVYLIQIIDANVFSYMHHFEVTEDIAMQVAPAVITPEAQYAFSPSGNQNAFGLRLGFTF